MSKTKSISYLLVSIILTLGLSISLQSLLAQWTAPVDAPPDGNVSGLLTTGVTNENQSIAGGIGIEQNLTVDATDEVLGVDTVDNRVGIGTIHPEVDLDVDGSVRIRDLSSCASGKVDVDGDGNLICGTDAVNDADADNTNEIQGVIADQGLRINSGTNELGLMTCSDGEIVKRSGGDWVCASEGGGSITAADIGEGTFSGDYTVSGSLTVNEGVKVGASSVACNSTSAGTIRWNSGVLEVCNGSSWVSLSSLSFDLVNGMHSSEQCTNLGGTVYDTAGIKYCRFNGVCPSGWSMYENWSRTISKHCGTNCDCNTGGHSSFANIEPETCGYGTFTLTGSIYECRSPYHTCSATIAESGCY